MCQVLRGESGLGDHSIDFLVEPVEGGSQRSSNGSERWQRGGEAWSQKAVVGSGKEERNAPAEIGDAISEAIGSALNQAVEAKPAQLVGHCAGGDRCGIPGCQGRKMLAQIGGPEALRELSEQDEGLEKRLNAWVGKTQAGRALAAGCHRSVDGLQSIFAEDAIVAQPLDLDQPLIGRKSDRAQLCKIVQAFADAEVVSVVYGRLGPQGSVFLVVLLDARVLVIDIQGWGDILRDHSGAKAGSRMARDPAIEDEFDLLRAAEIEVLADHLLEEQATVQRPVEDLGGGELRLQDRDIVAVAGLAVRSSEGMRQEPQPFAQQCIDLGGGKSVANRLQALGVGTLPDAVVEGLEGDAFLCELTLGVFMPVEAELGIERKVAAELEKERSKISIDGIDVIVVDHRAAAHDPRIRLSRFRVAAPFGPEHRGVLLGLADEHDPFLGRKAPQMLGHHLVLALSLAKLRHRNLALGYKVFQLRHEPSRHRAHQRGRRQRLAAMFPGKPDDPLFVLQPRHKDVEVHQVDPLNHEPYMMADDLGHTLCYHLPGPGRAGVATRRRLDRSSVLETGFTRARHEPATGATTQHASSV